MVELNLLDTKVEDGATINIYSVVNGYSICKVEIATAEHMPRSFKMICNDETVVIDHFFPGTDEFESNLARSIEQTDLYREQHYKDLVTLGELKRYINEIDLDDDTLVFNTGCNGLSIRIEANDDKSSRLCMDEYGYRGD